MIHQKYCKNSIFTENYSLVGNRVETIRKKLRIKIKLLLNKLTQEI